MSNRGIYNTTSAMLSLNREMQVKTQNISNAGTHGYKYDVATTKTFNEMLISYKNENVGQVPTKLGIDSINTIFTQGAIYQTGRELDFAIDGDAYFKVLDTDGNISYTRAGSFSVDINGNLTDQQGRYILGENGTIKIPNLKDFSVTTNGNIYSNGQILDTLSLSGLKNGYKIGNNCFRGQETEADYKIHQGFLENSNTDLSKELTETIFIQRCLTSNQKVILTQDELNETIINSLSK